MRIPQILRLQARRENQDEQDAAYFGNLHRLSLLQEVFLEKRIQKPGHIEFFDKRYNFLDLAIQRVVCKPALAIDANKINLFQIQLITG